MLITKLMGGLGNQLFQIFTLMSVSIDNDIDFKIFEYKDDKVSPHDINSKRNSFWDTLFKNIYDKTFKSISGPIYQYNENIFHYTAFPKIRDKSNNYSLFGYFQSYKYFQNNLKKILDLLKWHEIKKPYGNKYDYKNTVSLHFRIGDYINIQTHHPILPIDYYKNSLDRLIADTDKNDWNILYFYEKNDKDIVDRSINELKNKYPNLYFIEINHNLDDWEQMICMTFCSHNIIANSTFSWWGAYLNNNDNHVYYPDVWFGSAIRNKNLNDLFLNDWQKVTCNEISDSIRIKFLCGFSSNSQCLENYMNVYDIKNKKYKNIEFVDDNTYTHLVIIGDLTQENIKYITDRNISSNNIIGFSYEPLEFSNFSCINMIKEHVSEYYISKAEKLNHNVFKNGYTFQWHTWKKNLTKGIDKKYKMSIILSFKKIVQGHIYRHLLVNEILKTDMDIHIYGNGSEEHGQDKRIKGVFNELEPYEDYKYHICIENTPDTEFYISEKFTNCIVSNSIPIYYGAEKVNEIFGNNCCYKLTGDISKDMKLITDIYNNSDKYTLNLNQSQHELFNGRGSLPEFLYRKFSKKEGITILMPIYNGIEFIEESVSSIIKQTYTDWELIIGINGHPPDSEIYKKAKEYSCDKIKVYDLIDIQGKSNALNEMLKYSNFNWVSLLDVDDIWLPKKLESQIPYMKSYDIIGTQCEYFGDITGSPNIPLRDMTHFDFYKTNPVINSSCLVKKKLCDWNGEFNGVEDYDMWLRLWKQNYKFYNVETIQVLHRIHKQSAFNNTNNNRVEKLINYHKSQ